MNAPKNTSPLFLSITMILIVLTITMYGCNRSGRNTTIERNASVPDLLGKLPNLKLYDIKSCSYIIEKSSTTAWVPSPSDLRVELKGSVVLSVDGAKMIKSQFSWQPISRTDIPGSLSEILPAGDVLVSQKLNESFTDNPTYRHGFVVTFAKDDWSQIYLLATDLDHPIRVPVRTGVGPS